MNTLIGSLVHHINGVHYHMAGNFRTRKFVRLFSSKHKFLDYRHNFLGITFYLVCCNIDFCFYNTQEILAIG